MKRPNESVGNPAILWAYIHHLEQQLKPSLTLDSAPKNKAKGTLDECVCYCVARKLPSSDGEWFFDRMETVGWCLGKAKVKDWQACVRTWEREGFFPSQKQGYRQPAPQQAWQPASGI